jgi:hypothetical protein
MPWWVWECEFQQHAYQLWCSTSPHHKEPALWTLLFWQDRTMLEPQSEKQQPKHNNKDINQGVLCSLHHPTHIVHYRKPQFACRQTFAQQFASTLIFDFNVTDLSGAFQMGCISTHEVMGRHILHCLSGTRHPCCCCCGRVHYPSLGPLAISKRKEVWTHKRALNPNPNPDYHRTALVEATSIPRPKLKLSWIWRPYRVHHPAVH